MTRRVAIAVFAVLLVVSPLAGLAAAQAGNSTATPSDNSTQTDAQSEWSPPGPFSIQELKTGGTKPPANGQVTQPDSIRSIGTGGLIVRYRKMSMIDSSFNELESGQTVNANRLNLKSTAYLDAVGEYQMVLVYWEEETKTVNGTTTTYAADQTVQRVDFNVDKGWSASTIKLKPHYDKTVRVTAWLERDGERVEGARWLFKHRSNPLAASPAFSIDSKTDQWRWAGMYAILPGIVALLVSGRVAKHFLDRAIIGAQRGIGFWAITVGLIIFGAAGAATFATATVLANAPAVAGLTMGLIGFVVMLGINDTEVQKAAFFQRRVDNDAITPTGDEAASSRVVPNRIKNIVERGSDIHMPAEGLRPMFARYWAAPASAPKNDLQTVDEGDEGSALAKMYEIDPASDEVLHHTPAHLSFEPNLTVDVDEEDLVSPPDGEGVAALPGAISASLSNLFTRLNLRFIAIAFGGGALLYFGGMQYFGSQLVAGSMAVIPGLLEGTKAKDGQLTVEPAPYHYNDVRATVATERQEYVARETFEQLHKQIQDMDWQALDRAQDTVQALRQEMSEKMDQMFGTNLPDVDAEGGSDDDDPPWATETQGEKGVGDD